MLLLSKEPEAPSFTEGRRLPRLLGHSWTPLSCCALALGSLFDTLLCVILAVPIKLCADAALVAAFGALLAQLNEACSWLAKQAFDAKIFGKLPLQKHFYADLRARFGLQAQQAIRTIAKVADAFASQKANLARRHARQTARHARAVAEALAQGNPLPVAPLLATLTCPVFRPDSAFPYDGRLFSLTPSHREVSLAGPATNASNSPSSSPLSSARCWPTRNGWAKPT